MKMKAKTKPISVVRPEVEFEYQRPILGRLLLPFYAAWVYLRFCRMAKIRVTLNGDTIAIYRVLVVPQITGVDAVEQ